MTHRARLVCAVCDKSTDAPNEHGFCEACTLEFQQVRAKLGCGREDCATPFSCKMKATCLGNQPKLTS